MRRVDKLGRVVIPSELREKYGLVEGAEVEFLDVGEGVTVRAPAPFCRICHKDIPKDGELPLCEGCLAKAARHFRTKR